MSNENISNYINSVQNSAGQKYNTRDRRLDTFLDTNGELNISKDWMVNQDTSPEYIKNRTHYKDFISNWDGDFLTENAPDPIPLTETSTAQYYEWSQEQNKYVINNSLTPSQEAVALEIYDNTFDLQSLLCKTREILINFGGDGTLTENREKQLWDQLIEELNITDKTAADFYEMTKEEKKEYIENVQTENQIFSKNYIWDDEENLWIDSGEWPDFLVSNLPESSATKIIISTKREDIQNPRTVTEKYLYYLTEETNIGYYQYTLDEGWKKTTLTESYVNKSRYYFYLGKTYHIVSSVEQITTNLLVLFATYDEEGGRQYGIKGETYRYINTNSNTGIVVYAYPLYPYKIIKILGNYNIDSTNFAYKIQNLPFISELFDSNRLYYKGDQVYRIEDYVEYYKWYNQSGKKNGGYYKKAASLSVEEQQRIEEEALEYNISTYYGQGRILLSLAEESLKEDYQISPYQPSTIESFNPPTIQYLVFYKTYINEEEKYYYFSQRTGELEDTLKEISIEEIPPYSQIIEIDYANLSSLSIGERKIPFYYQIGANKYYVLYGDYIKQTYSNYIRYYEAKENIVPGSFKKSQWMEKIPSDILINNIALGFKINGQSILEDKGKIYRELLPGNSFYISKINNISLNGNDRGYELIYQFYNYEDAYKWNEKESKYEQVNVGTSFSNKNIYLVNELPNYKISIGDISYDYCIVVNENQKRIKLLIIYNNNFKYYLNNSDYITLDAGIYGVLSKINAGVEIEFDSQDDRYIYTENLTENTSCIYPISLLNFHKLSLDYIPDEIINELTQINLILAEKVDEEDLESLIENAVSNLTLTDIALLTADNANINNLISENAIIYKNLIVTNSDADLNTQAKAYFDAAYIGQGAEAEEIATINYVNEAIDNLDSEIFTREQSLSNQVEVVNSLEQELNLIITELNNSQDEYSILTNPDFNPSLFQELKNKFTSLISELNTTNHINTFESEAPYFTENQLRALNSGITSDLYQQINETLTSLTGLIEKMADLESRLDTLDPTGVEYGYQS